MADTLILDNSIWPNGMVTNSDDIDVFSPLGTIKVTVPTSSSEWPKGDKLVSPFVYEDGKLVGFIDTKALTTDSQTTIYLPYEHIDAEFSAIDKGQLQIHAPKATIKKISWADSGKEDIPEVQFKYKGCTTLNNVKTVDVNYQTTDIVDGAWTEPLWDLENGSGMFQSCTALTSFNSDLPSLTNGSHMFSASYLSLFASDLSSLTTGNGMFNGCKITTFTTNLPNLTSGNVMFNNCINLVSFSSELSKLSMAPAMFQQCINLTSFSAKLSSLTNGTAMFYNCKLDAPSVKNIIDTINTYSATLTLGMGCNDTTEDKDLFAQEVGYADMTSLLAALQAKGWTVTTQYNGRPTTTYGLRRTVEDTLPVYVKLEEVEDHADYTSLDDSKNFRLNWFHETTGSTDGYTQFNSLEEAIETLNIKPIEIQ